MRSRKNRRKQSISSRRKPPKNTRRERETRAEAIPERRWVVHTLSQRAGGDIQIPKRPAPAKRLSSTGLYLKGRQGSRRAVLFAGPPDTTFYICYAIAGHIILIEEDRTRTSQG